MAGHMRHSPAVPLMQPSHHAPVDQYLGMGELPAPQDDTEAIPKSYGDPERELIMKQAPSHARVALGKEKDRKPVDPPPVIQLLDKKTDSRGCLYDSPYLFMSCSLVAENYDDQTKGSDVPSNYLTGSLVSSIHRLKDSSNNDGGFFIFGDLSVKQEGRFRLRFTLYDKDERTDPPTFYFVSEIISNPFTVYSPKNFPGMSESTFLTRTFSDQGVKLRLRKDSRALTTRKRNRQAADSSDALLNRQIKRTSYERTPNLGSYAGLSQMISPGGPQGLGGMPGGAGSQTHMSATSASSSMAPRHPGAVLPLPTTGYYSQGYAQPPGQGDTTTGASFSTLPAYNNNGYSTGYGMGQMLQQMPNPTGSPAQTYMSGFSASTGRGMPSPYGIGSDQISQPSQDTTPRSLTMMGQHEHGRPMMDSHAHDDTQRQMAGSNGHYGGS